MHATDQHSGLRLNQAALIAGLGLLTMAVAAPFAEFAVYARLVSPDDVEQTLANINANRGLYITGIFAMLLVFTMDIVVAWALYVLLAPVNRALSLLTAWFRVVYAAVALFAVFKLATVFRLAKTPDYEAAFGIDWLHAQAQLLLKAFRYEWGMGLLLFGIHLCLLGYLVYRSPYIPRILGVLLFIVGLAWLVYESSPYLLPGISLDFLYFVFAGELIFMLWLLIRGRRIQEPAVR